MMTILRFEAGMGQVTWRHSNRKGYAGRLDLAKRDGHPSRATHWQWQLFQRTDSYTWV